MTDNPASRAAMVAPILWGLVAAAAGLAVAPLDPNLLEEGIVVHTAQRMLAGDRLFRDVVSHTGPLPYEFLAILFQLFGAKILVARAVIVLFQAVGTAAVFATARRGGLGALAHPAAAVVAVAPILMIPLFSIYYYTTIAFYLGLVAVYAGLRARESNAWALAAGILVAAIALCKQNTGIQFAVCFVPAVAFCAARGQRLQRAGVLALGGVMVAIATLGLYAARGDFANLLHAQLEMPFAMASEATFRTPYINFWPIGQLAPIVQESWAMYLPSLYHIKYGLFVEIGRGIVVLTQFLYLLPFVALAWTVLRGIFGRNQPAVWIHAAFLAAMTAGLYPRADWGHLVVALPPAGV
jgi:4-amino-4-deoxy-L-arabinose transferase-like glycosyltransferase